MSLALLFAAAVAVPRPTELKTFGDWIAGCDNARACEARALVPEGKESGWSVMEIRRSAAADAHVAMTIVDVETPGSAELVAGARRVGVHVEKTGVVQVPAAFIPTILAAARTDPVLLLKAGDQVVSRISLNGGSAAMLWIDVQQKRLGTVTALSRPGLRSITNIPAPPLLPVVLIPAARSDKPPAHLTAAALIDARGDSACKAGNRRSDELPSYYRLDLRLTLVLVPLVCISGDYNVEIDAQLIDDSADGDPQPAKYEKVFADGEEGGDITNENTTWDPKLRRLSVSMKGRVFGDCGSRREYAWDGRRFRFVFEEDMGECRGASDYIPTWSARVVER